jgi:aspartyl-tRNA(Asn)/glutamyl-tRNA(Gln) amidotransferase subunit B
MSAHAEYEPVIGLEIHVQLKTRTKMFCGCEVTFGEPPNTQTCPVCLGLPGALPVTNARAVQLGLMIGLALSCEIAERSLFHRKNYFYPDNPKAYQISQYDVPLCRGGRLGDVRIHRVHLEEDAAKLNHLGQSGRIHGADRSWVDFNRCGTPLVEIVTEPDIRSPGQARDWLIVLRETLRQIGVSDVDMSQGSLRCDANVSVRPAGTGELGTKTELKNMNSFAFLERGIGREIERQVDLLHGGGTVTQETLHFDPTSDRLTALRSKEEAHDYRYFPEPDLVPLQISAAMLDEAREELPSELPAERAIRFERELGLTAARAREFVFRPELADYFERVLAASQAGGDGAELPSANDLANWIPELVQRIGPDADPAQTRVAPESLATLVAMVKSRSVSRDAAREVLSRLVEDGGDPTEIVAKEGLGAISAGEDGLGELVDRAIASDPDAAEQVRSGNMRAIGPLIGYVMKETKGRADGQEIARLIRERLG